MAVRLCAHIRMGMYERALTAYKLAAIISTRLERETSEHRLNKMLSGRIKDVRHEEIREIARELDLSEDDVRDDLLGAAHANRVATARQAT